MCHSKCVRVPPEDQEMAVAGLQLDKRRASERLTRSSPGAARRRDGTESDMVEPSG